MVKRNSNCSFVLNLDADSDLTQPRCKACLGEKSAPCEPEFVTLIGGRGEKKAVKRTRKSPRVTRKRTKRESKKRRFQCPTCDKFLSTAANLRLVNELGNRLFLSEVERVK